MCFTRGLNRFEDVARGFGGIFEEFLEGFWGMFGDYGGLLQVHYRGCEGVFAAISWSSVDFQRVSVALHMNSGGFRGVLEVFVGRFRGV